MTRERGFALLAVLWVVVALGVLAARAVGSSRVAVERTASRLAAARARWAAEACMAVALERLSARRNADPFRLEAGDTLRFANGTSCSVRGSDPAATGDPLLTDGRINVNHASDSALRALPGVGEATVEAMRRLRTWGHAVGSLAELAGHLAPSARESLNGHWAELSARLVFSTSSLVLTASGWPVAGGPAVEIEAHVAPVGQRVATLRRRLR